MFGQLLGLKHKFEGVFLSVSIQIFISTAEHNDNFDVLLHFIIYKFLFFL